MFWRLIDYLIFHAGGALVGWCLAAWSGAVSPATAAVIGVAVFGAIWLARDLARAQTFFHWLRLGSTTATSSSGGIWAELLDRVRRQLRSREQATRQSDARLDDFLAALQASPGGVVLLDSESRIEWFNHTAASHFGLQSGRDLTQHIGNLVRDPGFAAYYASQDYQRDLVIPGHENSASRPSKIAVHLHSYGDGRLLLLSRDITAVEQAEVMRRDFIANVSHEIRTPLTVLSGFVETLQSLPLSEPEKRRYLDLMAQQADRMQTLVSDLLTLSKLEGSPAVGSADWVSVHGLLKQAQDEARGLTHTLNQVTGKVHDITLEEAACWEIAGGHSELLSAITNLACNAVRHTPPGGKIVVRWSELSDGRGEFAVEDSGPGIAAEHIPRLTERFYRVDRSRSRETGGTGLGLAIVKHVVQRHGAELKIESTPGKGARFAILFPPNRVRKQGPVETDTRFTVPVS